MAKTAIALIVAGSGPVDLEEVTDLLNDAYPPDDFDVDLIIPVTKDLLTDSVAAVADWYFADGDVYPVVEKGAKVARDGEKFGPEDSEPQEVESFSDLFKKDDFKDWEDVHVLLALPEESEEGDYELYAGIAEDAITAGFTVKNLCAALDDVTISDEDDDDEPAKEPEPEPEPPKKEEPKKREPRKKPEPEPEPPRDDDDSYAKALDDFQAVVEFLEMNDQMYARRNMADEVIYAPITLAAGRALDVFSEARRTPSLPEDSEASEEPQEDAEEAPKRGRGRPRINFEEKQVWDEEENEWVKRPRGRIAKGTKIRTIHTESGDVLDEGVV